jgi:F5/8 type C domain-containing protein
MRERVAIGAGVVLAALAIAVGSRSAPPAAGEPGPATGSALVVSANLQDAVRPADAADMRDVDNFAARLVQNTPRPPDALLLTEVLGPAAERVARRLSDATGHRYRAVVAPGRTAFMADGAVRESAIVVDTDALRLVGRGGYERVQSEDQAHALVALRSNGLELSLVSAHAAGDPVPASAALQRLASGAAPGAVPVIGGDLRNSRCAVQTDDEPIDCLPQAFWSDLTLAHGYSDALFERADAQRRRLSVYLFAHGSVERAFVDGDASRDRACKAAFDAGRSASAPSDCRPTYYADAPFGWAIVGPDEPLQRTVVPAAAALDHCELGVRKAAVLARMVNNAGAQASDVVTATADAPLTVAPQQATLDVPAGQARNLTLSISAPQATTATGTYHVVVNVGPLRSDVAVLVPTDCTEPRVYATSFHPGFPPENAIDGDINTFWHSEYSPPTPLPQSLTLNLGEAMQVSELDYQPRFDGNLNGAITAYNIYVSTDGQSFTKVASGTWAPDARLKTATFAPVTARYVRLEATAGNNGSYASAAEVTVK